ncbi:hypothetical protein UE46_01985 [Listeria weihenstephanensis]|uniref:Uncharacterized protein n=1 Tax=Listeria weihenstephanensis TaxID=1006155 RepID=A0A1S7FRE4_9LIST|nr:hypothetical protein UE46_01985 [Listeria weihenstephanensis]
MIDLAGVAFDGELEGIAVFCSNFDELGAFDVGPQVAEWAVNNVDGSSELAIFFEGADEREFYNRIGIGDGPNVLEVNDSCGESGSGIGENIATVKCVGLARFGQAVFLFVDDANVCDGGVIFEVGQRAVIWGDDVLASLGFDGDTTAIGANTGINDRDKNGVFRPVIDGLEETIGTFPNIILRDLVCEVVDANIGAHSVDNAVHRAHCTVANAKIGL